MSEKLRLIFVCIAFGLSVLEYILCGVYLIVKKLKSKPVDPKSNIHEEVDMKYRAIIKDAKGVILFTKDFKSKAKAQKGVKVALDELIAEKKSPATFKVSKI